MMAGHCSLARACFQVWTSKPTGGFKWTGLRRDSRSISILSGKKDSSVICPGCCIKLDTADPVISECIDDGTAATPSRFFPIPSFVQRRIRGFSSGDQASSSGDLARKQWSHANGSKLFQGLDSLGAQKDKPAAHYTHRHVQTGLLSATMLPPTGSDGEKAQTPRFHLAKNFGPVHSFFSLPQLKTNIL